MPSSNLVLIDTSVENYQSLVEGVIPGVEVIILDSTQDGIEQITAAVTRHSVTALHLVSHGSPGCLYLGSTQLNLDTLDRYLPQLQQWGNLSSLVLYGCSVAAGDAGEEFINRLHHLTGAEISASRSRTGSAQLGGNWQLEVNTGSSAAIAFTAATLDAYTGVLEPIDERTSPGLIEYIGYKQDDGNIAIWFVDNFLGTSGGPGGVSNGSSGFGLSATGSSGRTAGVNAGMVVFVSGQAVGDTDGIMRVVGNKITDSPLAYNVASVTTDPVTISGLNITYQLFVDNQSPLARTYVTFQNPSDQDITVPVNLVSNLGSDAEATVFSTSSGDNIFTTADSWISTDDDSFFDAAAFGEILYDSRPGANPGVKPTAVSLTSFAREPNKPGAAGDTQGIRADYTVTIPKNSTRALMFLAVNTFSKEANVSGMQFVNAPEPASNSLFRDLTDEQRFQVMNWDFGGGIIVTPSTSTTTEAGGAATFNVVLSRAPSANVTLNLSSSNPAEGQLSVSSLQFTPSNVPQTFTVTGVDDDIDDGNKAYTILTSFNSTDPVFSASTPANITLTNIDNDTAGITLSPIAGNTSEAGAKATFTAVLTSKPTANVTIALTSSDTTEGTVPAAIVFTPADWNAQKTVTVTGVDDNVKDGNVAYQIKAVVSSSDILYDKFSLADLRVVNLDNDSSSNPSPTPGKRIVGTSGDDNLIGKKGNDRIIGLAGDDVITGLAGNDVIKGQDGRDTLKGGIGSDRMIGGANSDLFVLGKNQGKDLIVDFQNKIDRIAVTKGLGFKGLSFTKQGNNTLIANGNDDLAVLVGIKPSQLTAADFTKI
jgi:Ca2+-binding RTX toxin-like protein